MKIGIITRHNISNYGSLLQAIATEEVFKKLNYDAEIINYVPNCELKKNLVNTYVKNSKRLANNLFLKIMYKLIQNINIRMMNKKFNIMRSKYLNLSGIQISDKEELYNLSKKYDIICSGSDQIWGKIGDLEFDKNYFLDFVDDSKKCISYSSSFGTEIINPRLDNILIELFQKYDGTILVREKSACKILEKKGFPSQVVLDPTLLFTSNYWDKFIENDISSLKIKQGDKYILVYQLHDNKKFDKLLLNIKKQKNIKIIRVSPSILYKYKPGNFVHLPSLSQFLYLLKNAEYIITDSFHMTAFSIIYHKNFYVVSPGKTSTRIDSILQLCKIENRYISDEKIKIENKIDYKAVDELLEKYRLKSIELLKSNLNCNLNNNISKISTLKCTGCGLCENVCPHKAIEMAYDNEGFLVPQINRKSCTNCGACKLSCPISNKKIENSNNNTFGIINSENIEKSSSAGCFYFLAKEFIKNNYYVCGCVLDKNLHAKHIITDNIKEVYEMQGSKYVQSDIFEIFPQIKSILKNNKILFSGTGCQIDALRRYLTKEELNNVFFVEILCHGAPSPIFFKKYLMYLESKYNRHIINVKFRSKEKKYYPYCMELTFDNNEIIKIKSNKDTYYSGFFKNLILRESCYKCKYSSNKRVGDITLGDFWGLKEINSGFKNETSNSIVIVNNVRGKYLMQIMKKNPKFQIFEESYNNISMYNKNLIRPTNRPKNRDISLYNIKFYDFNPNKFKSKFIKRIIPKWIKEEIKKCMRTN